EMGQTEHQRQIVHWRLYKAMMQVESPGLVVDGMAQDRTYADALSRRADAAQGGIAQHASADALLFEVAVYCQSAQHGDGNRIGHVAADPTRRRCMRQRTRGQRVEANDGIAIPAGIADHEAVAATLALVTQRPRLQPLCKGFVATGESIEPMVES